jgi:AraC-like ligand binding domain.
MKRNLISKSTSESLAIDDFSSQLPVVGKHINEFALYHLQENVSLDKSYKMSDTFAIIVVYKGDLTIKIDGRPHSLSRGAIACIPPGKTLSLNLKNSGIDGYMMTFSSLFFELLQIPCSVSKDKLLINSESDPIENTLNRIDQIFSLIKDGLSNSDDLFRKEKLLNLVAVFYIEVLNAMHRTILLQKNYVKPTV